MPSTFTGELSVTYSADGKQARLEQELVYHFHREDSPLAVHVEKGFVTDFASVPKFLHWLIGPVEKHGRAAVLHDYLYRKKLCSRVVADAVFLEAMGVLGVGRLKRWTMFVAVRLCGWMFYRKA